MPASEKDVETLATCFRSAIGKAACPEADPIIEAVIERAQVLPLPLELDSTQRLRVLIAELDGMHDYNAAGHQDQFTAEDAVNLHLRLQELAVQRNLIKIPAAP